MPGTGIKVCVGGGMVWWVVCKPTLVFSLAQAEEYERDPVKRIKQITKSCFTTSTFGDPIFK